MPRGPRIDAPGAAHHIWQRGVGKMAVFIDDADCDEFLGRFERLLAEHGSRCFGFVLLSNHFHIALQTGRLPLWKLMHRLTTGYARYFNERHGHVGHVFQNRYGSRLLDGDEDLATVVAYIARNPLEAGLVPDEAALRGYAGSSYPALMGEPSPRRGVAVGAALSLFGRTTAAAREELRARVVRGVTWHFDGPAALRAPSPATDPAFSRFSRIAAEACARLSVEPAEVHGRCRRADALAARAEIAQRASAEGYAGYEIAGELGVSESAVCRLLRRRPRKGG